MAYIHECDMCGTRFENGFQMNIVSFFERNKNPLELCDEEKCGIHFQLKHVPLKEADPRLELCDECFDLLKEVTRLFGIEKLKLDERNFELNDYDQYIGRFERKRDVTMVYDKPMQLILKNFSIPDGVTVIGTRESIELFMNAAMPDTSDYMAMAGFYPWKPEED